MTLPDYCTLQEVKDAFPESSLAASDKYSPYVTSLITRVSRQIDRETNRKPGAFAVSADVTYYYNGPFFNRYSSADYWYKTNHLSAGVGDYASLHIDELATDPTSVSVAMTGDTTNYTLWPATNSAGKPNYYMLPYNAIDKGEPYTEMNLNILYGDYRVWYSFPRSIQIVGKFGYSTIVPNDVKEAVILQVIRLLRKATVNYVEVAQIDMAGQVMQGVKLDEDVRYAISQYRRMAI